MTEELFRSADLLVRSVTGHGESCCVVTFDSFTDFRTLDRSGFGEGFLNAAGIDAIHVISRDNDWYQYAEMAEAMACVNAATRRYARVVTYGSSMGAYAAIRLAGLAGAHAVLALSPQYSIDPAVVPWERRWTDCRERFRCQWERTLPFPAIGDAFVVYDPRDDDRRHIALLAARFKFNKVGVPNAGHPVTGYLAEVGLLQESVLALCRGTLDAATFTREARARRVHSAQYLHTLTKGFSFRRRLQRVALMREAVRLAPDNPRMASRLGIVLGQARQYDEAFIAHRRALALAPDHPDLMQNYSLSLEASGDLDAALAVMEDIFMKTGGAPTYAARVATLRSLVEGRGKPQPIGKAAMWSVPHRLAGLFGPRRRGTLRRD